MKDFMSVELTLAPADSFWGDNALVSFNAGVASIHLGGDSADFGAESALQVQRAARKLSNQGIGKVTLKGELWNTELRIAFDQGYYTAKENQQACFGLDQVSSIEKKAFTDFQQASHWVRKTINTDAEEMFPIKLAQSAADLLLQLAPESITYKIIAGDELLTHGFTGIHTVGRGSQHPPAMLQLDFNPTGSGDAPISTALVGKGITFDSGGYSIKPSDGMAVMKSDMGGAATLTGALALAISQGLNQRVQLFLCCAENMISSNAFKLGDIITYKNDITVEVLNTDAEGRLVLADGLLAAEENSPQRLIDAATLTGAAKMALGRDYNAVFGFDQRFVNLLLANAKAENEFAWQLPLEKWHQQQLPSSFADMANIHAGEGRAGASTAAAFLSRFAREDGQGWLHLDLAGCYQKSANDLWATGAKGHGIRTLAKTLLDA
ncbi:aminopeptidase PepB [Moritella viscosa]|uniref:Peptidase B n=1 Tax=Moritella viscosa TaxID=80854 RepID=A0A1L0APM8_9GAMM|nr:aminopeptidase PepB [Moritella viscosa]SGY84487.1 Peptidase B [Moritella viscosa]SHN97591.1 Peptidase B [Moritella viscosa]SHN97592.1 Peptidase B [Moritella viscosa]SHN98138.1 Peptidase B [Moritella viscosa]SHN98770.1 Peptidase B [Moritella viscosa]